MFINIVPFGLALQPLVVGFLLLFVDSTETSYFYINLGSI